MPSVHSTPIPVAFFFTYNQEALMSKTTGDMTSSKEKTSPEDSSQESAFQVQMSWTDVEDALPEEGQDVLCAAWKRGDGEARTLIRATHQGGGEFEALRSSEPVTIDPSGLPICKRVTHWMDLPPFPEEIEKYPARKNGAGGDRPQEKVEGPTNNIGSAGGAARKGGSDRG